SYVDGEVSETVQGIMVAENIEVTVEYRSSNGIFSVIYVNAKTGEQLKSVSEEIAVGNVCEHTIELPDGYKEGYTQGKTEDAPDSYWTSVSETMTEGGVLVTVYCIPNVYTVEFVIDEVVVDTREVTYGEIYGYNSEGEYFDFVAPEKQDYTFDGWYLGGNRIYEDTAVATAQNHRLVAVFTLNAPTQDKFVLTITYVKENGDSLYEAYTAELAEGEEYSVDSPDIGGFTPDKPTVSGTMQAHDVSVVVTYYADYSGEPVVLINVSWGSMSFGFEQGTWNPSTHQYEDDVFTPEVENANAIVIENVNSYVLEEDVEKKIKINATLSYTKNDGLEGMVDRLDGYFTRGGADSSEINGVEVSNGNSSTVYLWLTGDFNPDSDGLFEVGSCEVIISQGEYE
ncbi:MAG: hypothetical protein IJW79_10570, partial [Clostridia bacterium]|nr:hypothetical protein [Clostridia bacterium]